MKREYDFCNNKYIVEKDEFEVFDFELVKELMTDYFKDYDYVFGDFAYNKLRLKGFCDKKNKKLSSNNDIKDLDNYVKNYCAYGCKWFLLKKVK